MIAERIHYLSTRWDEAFHKVNCAAISDSLLDSELFGHEAGAFTGATKSQQGRFERANGGTLFLDELGTMPLRIQEKILRIIEYGEFERLGGQKTLHVDVRIVGATNENLPLLASQGKFRHDLLDRLAFDVVNVPALHQRKDDIPTLVDHFATRMCSELEQEYYSGFSPRAMETLLEYSWPGNIRELNSIIHYACALCPGDIIQLEHLPPEFLLAASEEERVSVATHSANHDSLEPPSEKESILAMLDKTDWNKAKTARLLGVSRATLYSKLLRYDIGNKP